MTDFTPTVKRADSSFAIVSIALDASPMMTFQNKAFKESGFIGLILTLLIVCVLAIVYLKQNKDLAKGPGLSLSFSTMSTETIESIRSRYKK